MRDINIFRRYKAIPFQLKRLPQWVCWEFEPQPDGRKPKKPPIGLANGRRANVSNPATWGTHGLAVGGIGKYGCEGVGFVFTPDDPFCGLDLDDCRHPETGELDLWAQWVVEQFSSYTELSPSGTGVHIYVQGQLPGPGRNMKPVEMYDQGHYLTMTGNHLDGTPTTIEVRQDEIDLLYNAAPIMVRLLGNGNKREKFERLFTGDTSAYGYDDSSADLALCSMAAHAGASAGQIDSLMRLSGLYREKWDEKHGRQTYGQGTIAAALTGVQKSHNGLEVTSWQADESEGTGLSLIPVTDLLTQPDAPVDFLIDGLIETSDLAAFAAAPGVGKSTLMRYLAVCVARDEDFLGYQTKHGPVVYLTYEGTKDQLRREFRLLGVTEHDEHTIYLPEDHGQTIQPADLQKMIDRYAPALVIVDTLADFLQIADINSYTDTPTTLKAIRTIAHTTKTPILMVHHESKNGTILGSVGILAQFDAAYSLKRHGQHPTLQSEKVRFREPFPPTTLLYDEITHKIKLGLTKEQADIMRARGAIIECLAQSEEPMTKKAIVEAVGIQNLIFGRAFKELRNENIVCEFRAGKRGNPALYVLNPKYAPDSGNEQQKA